MNAYAEHLIDRLNGWEQYEDRKALEAFRSSPPAFLLVPLKHPRKPKP